MKHLRNACIFKTCHPRLGGASRQGGEGLEKQASENALSYLCTIAKSLRRRNETHFAIILPSHKDHTLRLDATDLTRSKVCKDTDLLADHILRSILLCDTRNNHSLVDTCIDCELKELICLRHTLSLKHCSRTDIHLLEIIECALLLLRSNHCSLSRLCSSLTL